MQRNCFSDFSKEDIKSVLESSNSIAEALRKMGFISKTGNIRKTLEATCITYEIIDAYNITKFKGIHSNIGLNHSSFWDESNMFVENCSVDRGTLKKFVIKNGIIKNECFLCGLSDEWNGIPLVFILDHLNGINNDNRIENLRMLCPNCNSQQNTFAGRNTLLQRDKIKCTVCGLEHTRKSLFCSDACRSVNRKQSRKNRRKFDPTKDELEKMIWELPMEKIALFYGVSGRAIRKRCDLLEITRPKMGYFSKKK